MLVGPPLEGLKPLNDDGNPCSPNHVPLSRARSLSLFLVYSSPPPPPSPCSHAYLNSLAVFDWAGTMNATNVIFICSFRLVIEWILLQVRPPICMSVRLCASAPLRLFLC
jgi:hypothetical protein